MAVQSTVEIPSAVSEFYDRTLLERALPELNHELFGQIRPLETAMGLIIKFRRYQALSTTVTPLTEGVAPASDNMSKTDITATVKTYGAYVEWSDDVELTSPDAILTELDELEGEQSGQSIDLLRRDTLIAGTSVSYATGSVRGTVNTILTTTLLAKAHRLLRNNNASWIRSYLSGSTKVGTVPIRNSFVVLTHPHVGYDVRNMTGFRGIEEYGQIQPIHETEYGALPSAGMRFLESTHAKVYADAGAVATGVGGVTVQSTTGTSADVYLSLIFAQNAFGVVPLRGNAIKTFLKPRGSSGIADPLDQVGTLGWKAKTTQVILNDNFMTRIESAASA
mgnify:CR=1 FL=1